MSDTVFVLSARALTDAQLAQIKAVSPRVEVEHRDIHERQDLEAALTPQTEVVMGFWGPFDPQCSPKLRWVQMESAGVNQLHDTPLWHSDIHITSANGVHAVQIPEYVFAVLLSHFHHLPQTHRLQDRRVWAKNEQRDALMPAELRSATLGIVGYGAIGREVARLAKAFGMRVLATKRADSSPIYNGWTPAGTGDHDGSLPERYYPLDELHDLLGASDAVLLALPMTNDTRHTIGAAELAAMRPHALLINVGRGPLIDQQALINSLQAGRIGGAALDVTDPEPLPADSPLWSFEQVIITPHISGMSPTYKDRSTDLFVENLRRYLGGEQLLNEVQRELGY